MATRLPITVLIARFVQAMLLAAALMPAYGQGSLQQLESRAAALKARGDGAGALALWEKAAALDPQSARIQDEIGFLLAV
ncbi:MAG TPA: hypothetical protein VGH38_25860, partial [Bryobacteraceae bacterium]